MSDRKFAEIVTSGQSIGYGDKERGYRALCGDCGTYSECRMKEFGHERDTSWRDEPYFHVPLGVGMQELKYVAQMRAWNCCNEDSEPLDGFPECPEDVKSFIKR